MNINSYIGLDTNPNHEWVAVLWEHDRMVISKPYKNSVAELNNLLEFITSHYQRPKICLNPSLPSAAKIIKLIKSIPDAELVLMSNAGLKQHVDYLPEQFDHAFPDFEQPSKRAYVMACCAERMV